MTTAAHRRALIERLRRLVEDVALEIRGQDHWNSLHPGEPPITTLDDLRPWLARAREQLARDPGMGPIEELPDLPCRDWPEDFSHENGNYSCKCVVCQLSFLGHKRRVVCKECHDSARKVIGAPTPKTEGVPDVSTGDGMSPSASPSTLGVA